MELQFVRGVSMGEKTARRVCQAAEEHGIRLSAHAPYYINFNSRDPEKVAASNRRLLKAARVAALCGARNVVFHSGFYHDDPPSTVYGRMKAELERIAGQIHDEGLSVCLRPETGGKRSQFGALSEILRLSAELDGIEPCIDFGHLLARSGGRVNTAAEFDSVMGSVKHSLGEAALKNMHIHVQGIAYTSAGETRHLDLAASDMQYEVLLKILVKWQARGTVICESPSLEEDALLLKHAYQRLCGTADHSLT
jgi:deoxyribonuclease-4